MCFKYLIWIPTEKSLGVIEISMLAAQDHFLTDEKKNYFKIPAN